MPLVRRTSAKERLDDRGPVSPTRSRSCPVRLSIFSRELLLVAFLIGLGGYLSVRVKEGGSAEFSGRLSLRGHDNLVERVIFTPDGQTLVSCGWDRYVRIWNMGSDQTRWGQEIDKLPHDWHVFAITTTPDGKYLAAAGTGGFTVWSRSEQSGWTLVSAELGAARRCVAAASDSRTLALGGLDRTVRLWDLKTREETRLVGDFTDEMRAVQFSPDGAFLAACTFGGEFQIWDLKTGSRPLPIDCHVGHVQVFRFAPDNRSVALAGWDDGSSHLILWDYRSGTERLRMAANASGINDLAVSPDGRILASAGRGPVDPVLGPADRGAQGHAR